MAEDSTEDTIMIGVLLVVVIILIIYFLITVGIIKFQIVESFRIV